MKKNVLLIGGKSKAKALALSLNKQGYGVHVVNDDYDLCREIAKIKGVHVICGDGTKPFILDEARASECDFSIALTSKDEDALMASEICKKKFHVKKTVSLLSDPNKKEFFYQMGIDSVVCATQTLTSVIEQQTFIDEMENVIPIDRGQVKMAEVRILEDSPIIDKKLWEITLPKEVIVGCILRGNETIIPRGDTRICLGDLLVVIFDSAREHEVIHELTGKE